MYWTTKSLIALYSTKHTPQVFRYIMQMFFLSTFGVGSDKLLLTPYEKFEGMIGKCALHEFPCPNTSHRG